MFNLSSAISFGFSHSVIHEPHKKQRLYSSSYKRNSSAKNQILSLVHHTDSVSSVCFFSPTIELQG